MPNLAGLEAKTFDRVSVIDRIVAHDHPRHNAFVAVCLYLTGGAIVAVLLAIAGLIGLYTSPIIIQLCKFIVPSFALALVPLWHQAAQSRRRSLAKVIKRDARPWILYLRPFELDATAAGIRNEASLAKSEVDPIVWTKFCLSLDGEAG